MVSYRPEYPPLWQTESSVTQLALAPLTPADSREVLRAMLGGAPLAPAVEAQLVATAQGNPFFLQSLKHS